MKRKNILLRISRANAFRALLRLIKTQGKKFFYENSRIGREVITDPGSWKALDLIYGNDPEEVVARTFIPYRWADRMFSGSGAAKATRMRLEEYKRIMKLLGPEYAELNGGTVNILSMASGPGRDVIEVAEDLGKKGIAVRAACVDKCGEAMELGKRLAEEKRLEGMTFKKCKIAEIREYAEAGSFDIVITQGILDYFSDDRAVDLLQSARALSREGGTLLTSNMGRHLWIRFWMEFFGEWRLKYRNGKDLVRLLLASGYERRQIDVYRLPEGYHWMGLAKKGLEIG